MQVPKPSPLGEAVENAAKRLQLRMWPLCVSAQTLRAFMSSIMRWRSGRAVSVLRQLLSWMRLMTPRSSRQHAGLVGGYARTNGSFWPMSSVADTCRARKLSGCRHQRETGGLSLIWDGVARDWLTVSHRWLRLTGAFEDRYFGSDVISGDVNQSPSVIAAAISRL